MAKHLSPKNLDTCRCQIVHWFDDALKANEDDIQHYPERSGEIKSGTRLASALEIGVTTVVLDSIPIRPILLNDVIMVPDELMLVTAVLTPNTLTVVRAIEGSMQGFRVARPGVPHQFDYVAHYPGANVFVRRACDEHAAITDGKILCDVVMEENNRRNVASGIVGTTATIDRLEVWAVILKPDQDDGKGGWRFGPGDPRPLTFNFAGLLQQSEINLMSTYADQQFGPGLVTLERQ